MCCWLATSHNVASHAPWASTPSRAPPTHLSCVVSHIANVHRSFSNAGTVGEPFFPRRADGSILWDNSEEDWDPDGMSMLVRTGHAALRCAVLCCAVLQCAVLCAACRDP